MERRWLTIRVRLEALDEDDKEKWIERLVKQFPMFGDRKEYQLSNSQFDAQTPQFSPDGRWLAYSSDESGRYEIYVQSFPPTGNWEQTKRQSRQVAEGIPCGVATEASFLHRR